MITFNLNKIVATFTIAAVLAGYVAIFPQVASAAPLANVSDTLSIQTISLGADHTVVFRTPTGANESTDTITLTFPVGFNMNTINFADVDLAHSAGAQSNCTAPTYTNEETLAATPSATAWGAVLAGQVLTLTAPTDGIGAAAIAANACVQVQIGFNATGGDTRIINPSSAGTYAVSIAGTFSDTGSALVSILNDGDVDIAAVVAQSLTFSISDTEIGFGTLSSAGARFATGDAVGSGSEVGAHNLVVGTNAANGYNLTASGTPLTCAACGGSVITAIGAANTASTPGTPQFGIRLTATGGSGTVSAPYAAPGFAYDAAAFPDQIASATAATADTTYSVRYLANIAANTPAGAYSATITYVATANY